MLRAIRWLIAWVIVTAYDAIWYISEFWSVRVRAMHKVVVREWIGTAPLPSDRSRVAIVAIYPSEASLPFTINLLRSFIKTGFYVIVVSTGRLSDGTSTCLAENCHQLIQRMGIGRDFGSYKLGLELLSRTRGNSSVTDVLILANDSLFYPASFHAALGHMLADPHDWQCLFENYHKHYHAQSFFLLFRPPVFGSRAFREFWASYQPYSSRLHSIDRGEVGLSTALRRAGFVCKPAYSSSCVVSALLADRAFTDLARVAELAPAYGFDISRPDLFKDAVGSVSRQRRQHGQRLDVGPRDHGQHLEEVRRTNAFLHHPSESKNLERLQWIYRIGRRFELSNPTHFAGLLTNALFEAPIKRDLCYRGPFDIFQVLRVATGFSEAERDAMARDLQSRGLPNSLRGLQRVLYQWGRL